MQLHLFDKKPAVVHYFDRNGSLHSGYFVRSVKKGRKKGAFVVSRPDGHPIIPYKIRNIEFSN